MSSSNLLFSFHFSDRMNDRLLYFEQYLRFDGSDGKYKKSIFFQSKFFPIPYFFFHISFQYISSYIIVIFSTQVVFGQSKATFDILECDLISLLGMTHREKLTWIGAQTVKNTHAEAYNSARNVSRFSLWTSEPIVTELYSAYADN